MNILNHNFGHRNAVSFSDNAIDTRWERDALGDIKHGLDLVFALKAELEKFHPLACETILRLLAQ